ncbi:hypothetical protein MTO96_013241 [Rhipicephalus appendiculatus]
MSGEAVSSSVETQAVALCAAEGAASGRNFGWVGRAQAHGHYVGIRVFASCDGLMQPRWLGDDAAGFAALTSFLFEPPAEGNARRERRVYRVITGTVQRCLTRSLEACAVVAFRLPSVWRVSYVQTSVRVKEVNTFGAGE